MSAAEGRKAANEGMQRAADHAEAETPGWNDRAATLVDQWLAQQPKGHLFTSVEVRAWAEQQGLPQPPDNRAWGSVIRRSVEIDAIVKAGYVASPDKRQHGAPQTQWRKL